MHRLITFFKYLVGHINTLLVPTSFGQQAHAQHSVSCDPLKCAVSMLYTKDATKFAEP